MYAVPPHRDIGARLEALACVERIARRADCADDIDGAGQVDGLAQAADMDVDGAQFDVAVLAPDAVEQLPARKDAARMLHEMAQQAEFGRPHRDDLTVSHDLVRDRVELDVGIDRKSTRLNS